jgi:hypothetical protein
MSKSIWFNGPNRAIQLSFQTQEISQDLAERLALFEIQYLLQSRELICACHPDHSAMFVDHYGSLLVQGGGMVDSQSAYLNSIQSNQL